MPTEADLRASPCRIRVTIALARGTLRSRQGASWRTSVQRMQDMSDYCGRPWPVRVLVMAFRIGLHPLAACRQGVFVSLRSSVQAERPDEMLLAEYEKLLWRLVSCSCPRQGFRAGLLWRRRYPKDLLLPARSGYCGGPRPTRALVMGLRIAMHFFVPGRDAPRIRPCGARVAIVAARDPPVPSPWGCV